MQEGVPAPHAVAVLKLTMVCWWCHDVGGGSHTAQGGEIPQAGHSRTALVVVVHRGRRIGKEG